MRSFRSITVAAVVCVCGCTEDTSTPASSASPAAETPTAIADVDLGPLGVPASPADAAASDAAAQPAGPPEDLPEVVARIGDEDVTREQYQQALGDVERLMYARYMMIQDTTGKQVRVPPITAEQRQLVLSNLIDKQIALDLAEEAGITATEEEIETRMALGRKNLESDQNYADYLAYYGKTEEKLRVEVADRIREEKFVAQFAEGCVATDDEIVAEYERLNGAGQLEGPEETDFWHILVRVPPGADEAAWQAAEEKITAIHQRVTEGGENFAAVAREVSEDPSTQRNDGYLEKVPPNLLAPSVDARLKEMKPEEISEPVRASYGFHILKLDEYRPEGTRSLEQMRARIEETLLAQCRQEKLAARLAEARASLNVEVYYRPLLQSPEPQPTAPAFPP
ncbi:MAG: peptidylprolyl isomerase, partial [Candidatus Hydrogenedentales bacterium]